MSVPESGLPRREDGSGENRKNGKNSTLSLPSVTRTVTGHRVRGKKRGTKNKKIGVGAKVRALNITGVGRVELKEGQTFQLSKRGKERLEKLESH